MRQLRRRVLSLWDASYGALAFPESNRAGIFDQTAGLVRAAVGSRTPHAAPAQGLP